MMHVEHGTTVTLILATDAVAAKEAAAARKEAASDPDNMDLSEAATNFANVPSIRVRPEWLMGVPRVIGKYGRGERTVPEPTFLLNESGGTSGDNLKKCSRRVCSLVTRIYLLSGYTMRRARSSGGLSTFNWTLGQGGMQRRP